jgi:Nicotinate phosphoribosyltransferase (NAPRTase) N-terminal domain/Nicotinate phosphoribosyltransferase (NAPRTase) family
VVGLGPALALVEAMRFGRDELIYLRRLGFARPFLDYLKAFRFSGRIDAMPEGTVAFAGEPLLRVTAPRIEAQLLETLLLNQINFQTAIATKAARLVLAAGTGAVVDFSPRRDHGVDAAMKAARAAAIAGAAGTSNVAAAKRYGLTPVGTMAHSYVLSFATELDAFRAFMRDTPENAVMLVDTYDTVEEVRRAIAASRETGVPLKGVRLDSGDRLALWASAPISAPAATRRPWAASTSSSPTAVTAPGGPWPSGHPTRRRCPAPSRSSATSPAASCARTFSPSPMSASWGDRCSSPSCATARASCATRSGSCAPEPPRSCAPCRPQCPIPSCSPTGWRG